MNGILIRQVRKSKGWTQQQLAQVAGISQSVIAELESGTRTSASLATLRRLATALNITVDALLAESVSASPAA